MEKQVRILVLCVINNLSRNYTLCVTVLRVKQVWVMLFDNFPYLHDLFVDTAITSFLIYGLSHLNG